MSRQQNQPISAKPQDMPTKAELARLRVEYAKDSRLAYLGHLDLIATIERCVRRARLPFSIGNGFARRMRIQFSSALPVGASSEREYYDVRLNEAMDPNEALALLRAATPPALAPLRASYVPGRMPALEAWLNHATWEVACPAAPFGADDLAGGIEAVRAEGSSTYLRGEKEKRVDVTSTLAGFQARQTSEGVVLTLSTRSGCAGALRPQVLLSAALSLRGLEAPPTVRVCRTAQHHEDSGCLVEPLGPFATLGDAPLS